MRGQSNHSSRFIEMFGTLDSPKVPVKRMIEVSNASGQYGLNASAVNYIEGRPRYIRITDICDDGSLNDDIKCSDIDDSTYSVNKGDVLFARTGATVGKTYLHRSGDACFAGYLIRYSFTEAVDPEYILAYTHSDTYYDWVLKSQKVGAQPNISASQYDNMPILIPGRKEQEAFLCLYRQADKSKFTNFKSRFISRFLGSSYSQKRLGEVANVFSGKTINLELENEGGPIAYLKVADLNLPENDRVVTTSSRFVTEETARTSGLVPIGATIFPKNGAAALHNKKRITSVTTCVDMNTMAVYSTSNTVIPEYLYAYLESQDLAALTLVGAIPQIRAKDVQSLVIPVPPIREQEQYVAVMHQADKSKYLS